MKEISMTLRSRLVLAIFACLVALVPVRAQAADPPDKMWNTVKGTLHEDIAVVARVDFAKLREQPIFIQLFNQVLAKEPNIKKWLDESRNVCNIDLLTQVEEVIIGGHKTDQRFAAYLRFHDLNEPKITKCFNDLAKRDHGQMVVKRHGKIVEYRSKKGGKDDSVFMAWLDPSVALVTSASRNIKRLENMLSQNGGFIKKPKIASTIDSINKASTIWAIGTDVDETLAPDTAKPTDAHGTITIAAGMVTLQCHVNMVSAADAAKVATNYTQMVASAKREVPPEIVRLLQLFRIGSNGNEFMVNGSVPQSDLLQIAQLLLQ
jgi:hypothetical protein